MEIIQDSNKPVDDNSINTNTFRMEDNMEQQPKNPEPARNDEPIDNNKAQEKSSNNTEKKKCCCKCNTVLLVILLIAVAALYVLHFTGMGTHSKHNPNATAPVVAKDGVLKVAYVNSDSLLAKYEYAKDMEKELLAYKTAKENNYKQQMTQFQNDYNNYLKTGDQLTLTQQQNKEAELKQRAERLSGLEAELASQVMERQMTENTKLLNAIFAFIREYNEANQQFDIILRSTFNDSPTLYVNPGMDITDEIIEGLNEEYRKVKGKKEE